MRLQTVHSAEQSGNVDDLLWTDVASLGDGGIQRGVTHVRV